MVIRKRLLFLSFLVTARNDKVLENNLSLLPTNYSLFKLPPNNNQPTTFIAFSVICQPPTVISLTISALYNYTSPPQMFLFIVCLSSI
jgi:hypothetical protein